MQKISESDVKKALFEYYEEEMDKIDEMAKHTEHKFSLRFGIKMWIFFWKINHDKLRPKQDKPKRAIPVRRLGTIMVAILLGILALGIAAVAIQNAYKLIERVFPKYSDVHYENPVSQEHGEFVLYEIAELPEGFVKDEENSFYNEKTKRSTNNFTEDTYIDVLRHKLGHAVGLRHTYEPSYHEPDPQITALMYPNHNISAYFSDTFQAYDLQELRKIYPDYPGEE